MIRDVDDLISLVERVYFGHTVPRPFQLLAAVRGVQAGDDPASVARHIHSTVKHISALAQSTDVVGAIFKASLAETTDVPKKVARVIGQMLLGLLAERAFEDIYKTTLNTNELQLEDDRAARGDTDYLVRNGRGRRVFRINIKFHGATFRNAATMVGVDPHDCFALATYKIYQGIKKQEEERLSYIFAVVGVRDLSADAVVKHLPADLLHLASFVSASEIERKRDVEDAIVRHLVDHRQSPDVAARVREFAEMIRRAEWRVLSARRADDLLRKLLFERVYAVRVRGFAQNYKGAEVDMHFKLSEDLTPLSEFLGLMAEHGVHGVATRLERGEI